MQWSFLMEGEIIWKIWETTVTLSISRGTVRNIRSLSGYWCFVLWRALSTWLHLSLHLNEVIKAKGALIVGLSITLLIAVQPWLSLQSLFHTPYCWLNYQRNNNDPLFMKFINLLSIKMMNSNEFVDQQTFFIRSSSWHMQHVWTAFLSLWYYGWTSMHCWCWLSSVFSNASPYPPWCQLSVLFLWCVNVCF